MNRELIQEQAKKIAPLATEWRRHIHAHPELSYQEFETCAFVQARLSEMGIRHEVIATTGVVGIIEGKDPQSRIIALRADMDALPILEENDLPYKSTKPGIMHACGHDTHVAILMTVTIKPRLSGIPTFVFVIDSKTGTEKRANTNKKKRKTKPITDKNCVHLAISIK